MLYLPSDKMYPNRFVETMLPTKGQIFDRTGKCAVAPNGVYTKDYFALIGHSLTEKAERFVRDAEGYESQSVSNSSGNGEDKE